MCHGYGGLIMFDAKIALAPLHDQTFSTFRDLSEKLAEIRLQHLRDLPADFGPRELFEIARQNGWVKEGPDGQITITLGDPPPSEPKPGDMLDVLNEVERVLPQMLLDASRWKGLDITYETPHVERLWTPKTVRGVEYRVYLHRIHPCKDALMHPHPWPSAVMLVSGSYDMGIAYGHPDPFSPGAVPPEAARMYLSPGSRYEMLNPWGWHWVKPLRRPVLSVMVTGTPWPNTGKQPGQGLRHKALDVEVARELLYVFRSIFA